jgi:hypothetical protein
MADRIQTYAEFFPYYLGEHRVPACRALHFVGTSIGVTMLVCMFVFGNLMQVLPGLLAAFIFGGVGFVLERNKPFWPAVALMFLSILAANPLFGFIAVFAGYLFPWIGHFIVEKNRPATFAYPVWSLVSDFRMYGRMVTGRLWSGDTVAQAA